MRVPILRAVYWDSSGFSIDLIDEKSDHHEILIFDNFLSYKVSHESYLLKVWGSLDEENTGHVFYQVKESEYIKQFNDLSLGIYGDLAITHYAVYTDDICVDILSSSSPRIMHDKIKETER